MDQGCPGERLNTSPMACGALPSGVPRQSQLTYRQLRTKSSLSPAHEKAAHESGIFRRSAWPDLQNGYFLSISLILRHGIEPRQGWC